MTMTSRFVSSEKAGERWSKLKRISEINLANMSIYLHHEGFHRIIVVERINYNKEVH
jgi:hypothetical protein